MWLTFEGMVLCENGAMVLAAVRGAGAAVSPTSARSLDPEGYGLACIRPTHSGVEKGNIIRVSKTNLSVSFSAPTFWPFFRFGTGIRHSIWNATQFVQGTPRLAASHRTCWVV